MKSPLITMTAVTGKPTADSIYKYLVGLKNSGVEQVMLYPRSGCELEYLSEEWFDTVGYFLTCAEKLDMNVWLYDDFNWPSGDAGGRVTAKPEYRLKSICVVGENSGKISQKSRHNAGLFGEKFFPDLLNPSCVDYFIQCTHNEYYKRFKGYFGTVIKGIFSDEASIGYCCEEGSVPYYSELEYDYKNRYHSDFYNDMRKKDRSFYSRVTRLISDRFNLCYFEKISNWCTEHCILFTGHLMCDNSPDGAVKNGGDFLKNLSSFTLPGIDEICSDFKDKTELCLLGSAEYAAGSAGAMAELFALGPCDMPFAKKRAMLYLCACHKIDRYFLAISHLDMRGNMLVTDFFNNFNTDQPDFAGMRLLSLEAKIASDYAKKDFTPDVYIKYPYELCAKNNGKWLNLDNFYNGINTLTYNGVQWKFTNGEQHNGAVVLEMNEDLKFDTDISKITGSISVLKKDGQKADGVFVRKFNDGSTVIINLFGNSGEYVINSKKIFLEEYEVKLLFEEEPLTKEELSTSFDIIYRNANMTRTMHVNNQSTKILCKEDTPLVFAIRNNQKVLLDGNEIIAKGTADVLSFGLKNLYKLSDTVLLKAGEHTIEAENDFKYMPCAFIMGDFSYSVDVSSNYLITLNTRKNEYRCGDYIFDYGNIELITKVTIPNGAKKIEFSGTSLYTLLYVNERLVGEKIASPYTFDIDKVLWGTEVTLKITQYSSIGNIFGNVDFWDRVSIKSQWRGTPSPKKTAFGFNKINWLF